MTETSIKPVESPGAGERYREFVGLYNAVNGTSDYKARTAVNAVYYGPDVFLNLYNALFTELLKEMENTAFAPAMKDLSAKFFASADAKAKAATGTEKAAWISVRNYFAVPHVLLDIASTPPTKDEYMQNGNMEDAAKVEQAFKDSDAKADTVDRAVAYAKTLGLDAASEKSVVTDLQKIFAAQGKDAPAVFAAEYAQYAKDTGIQFAVDFTQFTPRSHYTGSSLRRDYFRAMTWYIQLPFFLKSPALTRQAFAVSQLMAENPQQLAAYSKLESTVNFLVGASDDLMPVDYLQALQSAKGASDQTKATMDYLVSARQPKIKSIPAGYQTVGTESTADVLLKTKGMRFFSGKFILDSSWTGRLTQGDEAVKPGYTQKLPPMASSLEVMGLLGSDYARTQITKLAFYTPETSKAVDQAMAELTAEAATLTERDWQANIYMSSLWTIRSLFKTELPRYMQSPLWDIKTLQTASAFWTEMRHATLLYAKQSFAELGGGPGPCDTRAVPPPPMGYIEPVPVTYARIAYLAKRTQAGLKEQGFQLQNASALDNFVALMDKVQQYAVRELQDAAFQEKVVTNTGPDDQDPGKTCTTHDIEGTSDWETIRLLVQDMEGALPAPVEGPILSAKDKRTALVADVHTGGDSAHPTEVLYEGTQVPEVLLVAVKDANGTRLTIGFASSHHEFTQPYGDKRLTDEDWQKRFYTGDDSFDAYHYTDGATWPAPNFWYAPILTLK